MIMFYTQLTRCWWLDLACLISGPSYLYYYVDGGVSATLTYLFWLNVCFNFEIYFAQSIQNTKVLLY